MTVRYTRSKLRWNLILGSIWLLIGILKVIFGDFDNWVDNCWILVALLYIGIYFYEYHFQYLSIENGIITRNGLPRKTMKLSEIIQVKYFAGDYLLLTKDNKLTISTHIIDENSLKAFRSLLKSHNLEWKQNKI